MLLLLAIIGLKIKLTAPDKGKNCAYCLLSNRIHSTESINGFDNGSVSEVLRLNALQKQQLLFSTIAQSLAMKRQTWLGYVNWRCRVKVHWVVHLTSMQSHLIHPEFARS